MPRNALQLPNSAKSDCRHSRRSRCSGSSTELQSSLEKRTTLLLLLLLLELLLLLLLLLAVLLLLLLLWLLLLLLRLRLLLRWCVSMPSPGATAAAWLVPACSLLPLLLPSTAVQVFLLLLEV
jgi:hypothetical protein